MEQPIQILVNEDETVKTVEKLNKSLNFVHDSIVGAQKHTGAMTMENCKSFKEHHIILKNYIENLGTSMIANKSVNDAYSFLLQVAELNQTKGIYTVEGSIHLLENLRTLERFITKNTSSHEKLKKIKKKKVTA